MCNVLYKIVSKVFANRLKKILSHIISQCQSTFISGRLIIDHIITAFETFHTMSTSIKGKVYFMAMKLDMSKVDDILE